MVADKFIKVDTKDPGIKYQKFPEINKQFHSITSPKSNKNVDDLATYQKKILNR